MTSDGWHRTPGVMNNPLHTNAGFIRIQPAAGGIQAGQAFPLKTPAEGAGLGRGQALEKKNTVLSRRTV